MPRAYARRVTRQPEMPPELVARLYDEPYPADADPFLALELDYPGCKTKVWEGMTLAEVWAEYEAEALADWIEERPGTRPSLSWLFSAPRQPVGTYPGCFYDGTLPELRQRLGGINHRRPEQGVITTRPA